MSYTLFGTDGIRAKAFTFPLVDSLLVRLGGAFAKVLPQKDPRGIILVARDTRLSGPKILKSLAKGFAKHNFIIRDVGILPTPSLSYLVVQRGALLGCMISASHNPPEFNGIKFFGPNGCKIPREWEEKVEQFLSRNHTRDDAKKAKKDFLADDPGGYQNYLDFLRSTMAPHVDFCGMRVVVDCAYGATYKILPEVLRLLGARVFSLASEASGKRINVSCGAMDPEKIAREVKCLKADVGFALDGDGDRLTVVNEKGENLKGEYVLATIALDRSLRKEPGSQAMVTTIVSNFALKHFLENQSIDVFETPVGDRYVLESLLARGLGFGGENSGHYIWPSLLPSADATLTALCLMEMLKRSQKLASKVFIRFPLFPQVNLKVPAPPEKPTLDSLGHFSRVLEEVAKMLNGHGRVLVRYSGTEPVLRILLEGKVSILKLRLFCSKLKQAYLKEVS